MSLDKITARVIIDKRNRDDWESIECISSVGYLTTRCYTGHKRNRPLRCHVCEPCERFRVWGITTELIRRLVIHATKNNIHSSKLALWTLGTGLPDTFENRITIKSYFDKFRRLWTKWCGARRSRLLFYVIERGTEGGYLHVHIIAGGFQLHRRVISIWRSITGFESNVNFSRRISSESSFEKIARYMAKYLGKDLDSKLPGQNARRNYYYLGELRKIKSKVFPAICNMVLMKNKRCGEYILIIIIHDMLYHKKVDKPNCERFCYLLQPSSAKMFGGFVQKSLEYQKPILIIKKDIIFCKICESSISQDSSFTYWSSLKVHTTCLYNLLNFMMVRIPMLISS